MYRSVVTIHIIAALVFFSIHSVAAVMAFRLRRTQNLDRLRSMLNLSERLRTPLYLSLLTLVGAGIIAGFMANWWVMGWIGASLVLLILLTGWMVFFAIRYYAPLRIALGLRSKGTTAPAVASQEEIAALVKAANPWTLLIPGLGITAVIVWLMIAKPF
jgi:hypothetical protein